MPEKGAPLDQRTFIKLSRLYIIALSAIAVSVIISQLLVHNYLQDQADDSTVVNIAGRQRMLSQKLAKETFMLLAAESPSERQRLTTNISATLTLWDASHLALQHGNERMGLPGNNPAIISEMFVQLDPSFQQMKQATRSILSKLEENPETPQDAVGLEMASLKRNEQEFLQGMDRIVSEYEREAAEKVEQLGNLELLLMGVTLLLLLAELLFIFLPAARGVKTTIQKLLKAEEHAIKMAQHADILSDAKEKSVKELRALNQAMNQTLLFARLSADGKIIQLGEKFSRLFHSRRYGNYSKFSEMLTVDENERAVIDSLLEEHVKSGWQGEVKATMETGQVIWLEMSLIPFNPADDTWELLVIASDITVRKEAQLEIERLTKKSFEEKMNHQKLVSSKIIENQENEQNRIAKDIHDGIGQMLTGLNFNLESIDVAQTQKAAKKIEQLKELTGKIIKGVRTATFNLMPPELSDHGIVPALTKLTQELAKLTGKNILLYDKTGFSQRLDSLAEINIYRITQEAVNNAIKYAASTHIIVSVSHSATLLSIVIDDNGKGFQTENPGETRVYPGGMGMTFMKERTKYIHGRLFISSEPGKGTKITLNIPLAR